ncbi:MAG TPA: nickel-responsive transcriptional regulator NikR [Planctomycetota bacterium]|nr:nickel-responsive transcriptional regulator NikR [Planctomycetota bacterium]
MGRVSRASISLEPELFEQFDAFAATSGYATRSEAVKALMRSALVQQEWQGGRDVAGAIVMVYDHHRGSIVKKLTDVQHDFGELIVCSQHVHLDHHHCMEVVVVRGAAARIRQLLAGLKAVKGVKHSALMTATTGEGVR